MRITEAMERRLETDNRKQKESLHRKLQLLCKNSAWKQAGRTDIITNISKKTLARYELETLYLGLKFDTGKNAKTYADYVLKKRGSTWLRYVDDVLVIVPKGTNINNNLTLFNKVHKDIQFTVEEEQPLPVEEDYLS